jgi:hypothetical protein
VSGYEDKSFNRGKQFRACKKRILLIEQGCELVLGSDSIRIEIHGEETAYEALLLFKSFDLVWLLWQLN